MGMGFPWGFPLPCTPLIDMFVLALGLFCACKLQGVISDSYTLHAHVDAETALYKEVSTWPHFSGVVAGAPSGTAAAAPAARTTAAAAAETAAARAETAAETPAGGAKTAAAAAAATADAVAATTPSAQQATANAAAPTAP